ncbi:TetR/AcrR family transcriptional regulator [Levilactobacillus humaensis]|uniref:TetR/AcrR family transcriptional regulator n=1 Tax=Levilactobacillus humaensis TaxID=2950375 RepID=UPI0021C3558E|nr:TetR/AcrR family transcriptional regulator [Levilactobacillus humaensis]
MTSLEPPIFDNYRDWLDHQKMPKGKKAALITAMRLFSESGFDGTSTVQVAKEAGISQATIFKYFHTKQDLLMAIVQPVLEHFFPTYRDEFFRGIAKRKTLTEIVHFIVTDRYHFIKSNEQAVRIIAVEMMTNAEMRQAFAKVVESEDFNFLQELIQFFYDTGELRDDVDAAGLLRVIAGQMMVYIIQGTYVPALLHGEQEELEIITNQIVRTLKK